MNEQVSSEKRRFNHIGFSQYLSEHRLMGVRCSTCGEIYLPPRPMCPRCYQTQMEWVALSGRGRLDGFTVIYVGLPVMAAEGYDRKNPYCSGIVRLAEGPAVAAQICGVNGGPPTGLQVGDPVRAVFLERGEQGRVYLAFEKIADKQG